MNILYPPHPNIKILPNSLDEYEKTNSWIAQRKFNGTNVVINIDSNKKIKILTRHGTSPKYFSLTQDHINELLSLNLQSGKEYWFNGELLDHKTKNKYYKGKIVLFDILYCGFYLIKIDQQQRLELLKEICNFPTSLEKNRKIAYQVSSNIWMAETWEDNFYYHYNELLDMDEIEGLILRRKKSFIDNFGSKKYDASWIIKCRKPHSGGNYFY